MKRKKTIRKNNKNLLLIITTLGGIGVVLGIANYFIRGNSLDYLFFVFLIGLLLIAASLLHYPKK